MSLDQLRNANFGTSRADITGSSGVGYALLDAAGVVVSSRTTTGVYQLTSGSGLYAALVRFPAGFHGQLIWDCPAFTGSSGFMFAQSYAIEQYNVEENDPRVADVWQMVNDVTGSIAGLYDVAFGRWRIDTATNQMIFYRDDNSTVVATFDLFDETGVPTFDGVFERRLVGSVTP